VARFAGGSSSPPEALYLFRSLAQRSCKSSRRLAGLLGAGLLMMLVFSPRSSAQTPPPMPLGPQNPERPPLAPQGQADENWSFLSNQANRTDFWDPLKYIPLNQQGTYYLTFWFETRSEYEWFQNENWGQGLQTISGYLLQHVIPAVGLTLGSHFRLTPPFNMRRRWVTTLVLVPVSTKLEALYMKPSSISAPDSTLRVR